MPSAPNFYITHAAKFNVCQGRIKLVTGGQQYEAMKAGVGVSVTIKNFNLHSPLDKRLCQYRPKAILIVHVQFQID